MIIVLYIGSSWGFNSIAYSLLGLVTFYILPHWYYIVKPLCGEGFKEYFWQILKLLIFAIIGGIFAYGMSLLFGIENMYLNVCLIVVVMGIIVLVLNILFNSEFVNTVLELVGERKKV